MKKTFTQALEDRVLLLDGGFGTMLQSYDLGDAISDSPEHKRGCNDYLSISRPNIVSDIHRRYLEAGADIIETNSFNANAISLADYNLSHRAYEIAKAAATIARKVADDYSTDDRQRYVAGSVGPTNRTLSMSADVNSPAARDVTFTQMYQAYRDQVQGLIDGGVDVILVETVFDTLNAKAALSAIRDISADIPVMVSATVADSSGRTLTGQTIEAFVASVMHARPVSLGLNCGFGAKHLLPHLRRLAAASPVRISVHPNAGLPNVMGTYDETPQMFVDDLREYLSEGLVNIVGGCCGTTPDHIKALSGIVGDYAPRVLPKSGHVCTLSGLEPLNITPESNFINIGERTNVAGSAKFARLIREGNYDEALSIARAQVEAGAQIVDVCMDDALIDGVAAMTHFLNLMASEPEIARVPVMIDSSKWEVIEAGLQAVQGKSIVNSISLKEGEAPFIEHARKIMNYGAAAVVMLFDEQGQADTYQRKIAVAERAYRLLMSIGFNPEDIIFDPNILAVATGMAEHDRYARDFIDATRWIKQNLPYAKVSGGVSNLSFSFRGNNQVRKAMHAVFLYHAINAGMDMAIVNPQMVQLYDDIEPTLLSLVEDVILYRREDAAERLIEHAKTLMDQAAPTTDSSKTLEWRSLTVDKRIEHAMLKGETAYISDDALEAYQDLHSAVQVIDKMLMPAMGKIGELFAAGKMFLPQVVKSARVMKQAVATLEPYIKEDTKTQESTSRKRKILIATVKGDVHDIGKNIVSVVLACNGYEVHDLGVMVPAERIIEEARAIDADVICLSGLITPSLEEMINVAKEAERQGITTPILVGGATTSALHTALKIAPVTKAPVLHSTDAADNASVISALCSDTRDEFLASVAKEQSRLRAQYNSAKEQKSQDIGAENDADNHTPAHHPIGCPCCSHKAEKLLTPSISEVEDAINWSFFFSSWGIPGRYPQIFDDPVKGAEAKRIYDDAQTMLKSLIETDGVKLMGVVETFAAKAYDDDIMLYGHDGQPLHLLSMLRSSDGECVSDFVGQSGDKVTLFALTAGIGCAELCERYRAEGDDYSAIMVKLLCDRLVEAFADKVLAGGCRIAFGYPTAPDHTLKRDVFDILDVEKLTPMRLTETCMIVPGESICGIYFGHGHFFEMGDLSDAKISEYASRRGISIDIIKRNFK